MGMSQPSYPPCWSRTAAAAQASITSRISRLVITCGHSRWRSSRVSEGAHSGTPEYQEWPRRPRCEICERQSAPWR